MRSDITTPLGIARGARPACTQDNATADIYNMKAMQRRECRLRSSSAARTLHLAGTAGRV